MSLIQGRWLIPGAAAALAVAGPLWLLGSASPEIEPAQPVVVTALVTSPVGGLDQALTMPLFSASRAPAPPPYPSRSPLPRRRRAAALPTLVGLVSRARGKGVALVKASSGQTVMIGPGESVDGWQLVAIGRDRATFASNGERRVASLDFRNRIPAEGAPPPGPPGPPNPLGPRTVMPNPSPCLRRIRRVGPAPHRRLDLTMAGKSSGIPDDHT